MTLDDAGANTGKPAQVRVLLVDDQSLVRMGLRLMLEPEDDLVVVGEAADGEAAVAMARTLLPDIVLLDVQMPRMTGLQAAVRILDQAPTTKVIILTTFDLDEYVYTGLKAGASGFLLKDTEPVEMVAAIRSVAAGDAVIAPRITRRLLERFAPQLSLDPTTSQTLGGRSHPRLATLTERELDVLELVARGLSNAEIAAELTVSPATVKSHVGSILAKLELRDRVQAVVLAHETGLASA